MKQSSAKVQVTMDLFQHRYYRLNKMFLKFIGQWPYQRKDARATIIIFQLCIATSQVIPYVLAVSKISDDWDALVEAAMGAIFGAFCFTKNMFCLYNSQKMLLILSDIRSDWKVWSLDRDVDILQKYAEKGRKMTIVYAVGACVAGTVYAMQPAVSKIIDILLKNGTEPGRFLTVVDYRYIDMQKYYFYIILHGYVVVSLGYLIFTAYDTMFIVCVQHGCALFAILGRKLQRIGEYEKSKIQDFANPLKKIDDDFEHLVSCIGIHNHAIAYAERIENTYSGCFLFIMGFNILLISIPGIQIITRSTEPQECIQFIPACILFIMHLYIYSSMSQNLMDHSISAYYDILNGSWYTMPLKTQKILYFMTLRCNVPCRITAGKISVMCIETFATLLKTSFSYITVLRSG